MFSNTEPRKTVKVVTLALFVLNSKEKKLKLIRRESMGEMTLIFVNIYIKEWYLFFHVCVIRNEHFAMIY